MPVVRLDVPRRRQRHRRVYTECPMCIYLHHLSHICTTLRNGPFWMLAGAVLVLFFLPLGPFWRWAVLVGSRYYCQACSKSYMCCPILCIDTFDLWRHQKVIL